MCLFKNYFLLAIYFTSVLMAGKAGAQPFQPDSEKRANQEVAYPYKNNLLPTEERILDLLKRMTPEEKFWQLFMIPGDLREGKEKYKNGIFGFQVSTAGNADAAGQMMNYAGKASAGETVKKINSIQKYFVEETRLGIPIIAFDEALHGLVREGATAFPQSIALAATFDTQLMGEVATAIAHETKSRGIRDILSPVVNIASDVRWGRTEETYGEDPFLASEMGVAFVSAFESMGIVTTPKHFLANSGDGGRDSYPIDIDERMLEEYYLPPFRACIEKGGSRSIMTSYNSVNGSPATANDWLLNKKLKEQMNFKGFIISDAAAVGGANVLHYTAADYPEASANAMNNGLDVIFQTAYEHYKLFIPPFLDGKIDKETIDSAVARVLRVKFELGLFENPYTNEKDVEKWYSNPMHKTLARKAAQESVVLLKNEHHALPLSKSLQSVAIIGTDAVEARLGGYSGPGNGKINLLEGIKSKLGSQSTVSYLPGPGRSSVEYVSVPSANLFTVFNGNKVNGLTGEYFNNIDFSGEPVLKRLDKQLDFRWTLYSPDPKINFDFFSVKWEGQLISPATGKYKIGLEGNDGYRLFINGKQVLDNRKNQTYNTRLTDYYFEKDKTYDIRVEFAEASGYVWLKLVWDIGVENHWEKDIQDAVELAKHSDAVIVVAGIEEGESADRAYLGLPGHQEALIHQLSAIGKPVTVILVGGSAITMNNWYNHIPAILDVWYPGEEGGPAIADILFGDHNPAGRLPVTFPVFEGQLPLVYNHKPTGRTDDYANLKGQPLFPFGFGLSYTDFSYSDLRFDRQTIELRDSTTVRFKVKNTGSFDGDEVVQLYVNDIISSVAQPVKLLKGFQRIHLKKGEEKEVSFTITPELLQILDINMHWLVEPGDFRIMIGSSSKDIRLRGILTVK